MLSHVFIRNDDVRRLTKQPKLTAIIQSRRLTHQLNPHAYADDTQIYGFCRPANSADLCEIVSVCVDDVSANIGLDGVQSTAAESRQD